MGAGYQRRRRKLVGVEVKPLIAKIKAKNYEHLEAVADARGVSIVTCVDDLIEADWKRRERAASNVPRETVQ